MRRSDVTLTIALCLSLAFHALLCVGAAERYVHGAKIWLPGFPRDELAAALYIDEPVPLTEESPLRLGEPDAAGTAIDSSPGEEPLLAPKGFQDQPFLSRDPVGPGKVGDEPSESLMVPGDGSSGMPAPPVPPSNAAVGLPTEQTAMQPFEPPKPSAAPVEAKPQPDDTPAPPVPQPQPMVDLQDRGPTDSEANASLPQQPAAPQRDAAAADDPATDNPAIPEPEAASHPEVQPAPSPASPSPGMPPSSGARPGPLTAADPAPKAESEIDPISKVDSLNLRRGSTVARSGRKHRVTRPQLDLAAKADLFSLRAGSLVLGLRIDQTGNVSHVKILRSSGSEALDQTCKVAAYNWWFEPLTDKTGRRIADEFPFVIVF